MTGGRPKQFDEQEALKAAMEVFWRKGFEGTSCDELLAAMNIRCGSMYSTFGDKKALYEKVFDLYQQTEFENALKVLNGPDSPLENVRNLVRCWGEVMSQPDCKGCLVSNTLIEFGNENETKGIAKRARDLVDRMRATFAEKLAEAKQQGELGEEVNTEELAAFLVTSAQGLSVLARAGVGKEMLQGSVNTILLTLR